MGKIDCVSNISNKGSPTISKIYFLVRFVFKIYCLKNPNGTFKFVWFLVFNTLPYMQLLVSRDIFYSCI